jgi:hypothetical protein
MKDAPDHRKFQAALDRIEALGGHYVFDKTIQAASLAKTGVIGEDLALFKDIPSVQIIDLSETRVDDAGLERLADLNELETLVLVNTLISKSAIEAFRDSRPDVQVTTSLPAKPRTNPFTGEPL